MYCCDDFQVHRSIYKMHGEWEAAKDQGSFRLQSRTRHVPFELEKKRRNSWHNPTISRKYVGKWNFGLYTLQ